MTKTISIMSGQLISMRDDIEEIKNKLDEK